MTVSAGREFLMIPGPTTVPDEVLRAMHRPAVDIDARLVGHVRRRLMIDQPLAVLARDGDFRAGRRSPRNDGQDEGDRSDDPHEPMVARGPTAGDHSRTT